MSTIRELQEQLEEQTLSPYAALSARSRGRECAIRECDLRTCYRRDFDKILHSKSFRRLKHKTQVFLSPEGDHYRTRLTHTLEVCQIARTIGRALRLNEDLIEAIAVGHDLGHTPFGHAGERELRLLTDGEFSHNKQSLRVVDKIEKLNLTYEVRDGILCHTGDTPAQTYEGRVVALADRIAYINHDIDDALRAGLIKFSDLPRDVIEILGETHGARINSLVSDTVYTSQVSGEIKMSQRIADAMNELRNFMFKNVYRIEYALKEEAKVRAMIAQMFKHYEQRPDELPNEYRETVYNEGIVPAVCDYIACMTDRYAINAYTKLYIPDAWSRL